MDIKSYSILWLFRHLIYYFYFYLDNILGIELTKNIKHQWSKRGPVWPHLSLAFRVTYKKYLKTNLLTSRKRLFTEEKVQEEGIHDLAPGGHRPALARDPSAKACPNLDQNNPNMAMYVFGIREYHPWCHYY